VCVFLNQINNDTIIKAAHNVWIFQRLEF